MLTSLYGKVLNVYRMTSRTSEAKGLIQRIRRRRLDLDYSQAHSLMDNEIRAKNFHGALDLYNQFFPPLLYHHYPGSGLILTPEEPLLSSTTASEGEERERRGLPREDSLLSAPT